MVIEQDERDIKNQKDAEESAKQRRIELRNFQLMQFGKRSPNIKIGDCFSSTYTSPINDHASNVSVSANTSMVNSRKAQQKGIDGMSAEEIRMNRRLLEQISKFK